jgi:(2Fe-2S) ferredoxin
MNQDVADGVKKAGLSTATLHIFFCGGPDCCPDWVGEQVWEYLKRRVRELGISAMRTKTKCFRICAGGPWMVIYPDAIWYGQVNVARCERILQEHIVQGKPIGEWLLEGKVRA